MVSVLSSGGNRRGGDIIVEAAVAVVETAIVVMAWEGENSVAYIAHKTGKGERAGRLIQ